MRWFPCFLRTDGRLLASLCCLFHTMNALSKISFAVALSVGTASAWACASCGCSLSSDWESQGFSSSAGWRLDLRYDRINQNQVRSGTAAVNTWPLAGHEQELNTLNQYVSATLDYASDADWGVNVQVPMVIRSHATNGFNFDGTDAGTSQFSKVGDVKVIGRYQGLTPERNLGVQFGVKLPTGRFNLPFNGGAIAGQPLDRGLQPGTGTTDLILGVHHFSSLSQKWDYFSQAVVQIPLNSRDGYRPGSAINANLGFRYMGFERFTPQIQLNARVAAKDSGPNASPDDSGGQTLYLSPGVTAKLTDKVKVYGFVQLPLYQNLNGYQLAPKATFTLGTRFEF